MTNKFAAMEQQRLRTLGDYRLLDTAAEVSFDELTRLAAIICEAPISLISLVDDKRQWFKSRVGIDAEQTPREQAFCAHALYQDELFIVRDASADKRFVDNPLVTSDPNIRFYAGAPLKVQSGEVLGTLCVIDRIPRELTARQLEALATLRNAVVALVELRKLQADMLNVGKLLPMCAWCRRIRTQQDQETVWEPLESYVHQTNTISHCICPSCKQKVSAALPV